MIDDVLSLDKLHVVDLAGRLNPLESVLIRELHTASHHLISLLDKCIFSKSWIIANADETVFRQGLRLYTLTYSFFVIEVRRIKVSLIVVTIACAHVEDRTFAWSPLEIAAIPTMLFTEGLADALQPGVDRFVMELNVVVGRRFKLV